MSTIKQSKRQSKSKPKGRSTTAPKAKASETRPATEFDRARARLDKKKQERHFKTHWAHFWNLCPKCGGDMFEQKSLDIRYEVCRDCHGIYIDQAEAVLVLKHLDAKKWLRAMLRRSKDPKTINVK